MAKRKGGMPALIPLKIVVLITISINKTEILNQRISRAKAKGLLVFISK